MQTQPSVERMAQSSYRHNLLDAVAKSSIKRHKIREFINAGSGSSQINFMQNDENAQLAEHLLHLKTSCSGVKAEIKTREHEQEKFRDSTMFISEKVKIIQTERSQLEKEIERLNTVTEQVKCKKMNAMLGYKSYEHILDRMKKDEIRYQIKRNQLERELKGLQKSYKDLSNERYGLKEYEFLSCEGLNEAKEEVQDLNKFRKITLTNMSRVVDQKQVLQRKKQNRKQKSDMIKEMAAGDLQDADLIRMKKFLTAQVFFKSVLKSKIEKLKEFYQPYELAFLKIKGNTSVKDANSLTSEYYSFQNSYNEKASWVKHLEEQIAKSEGQMKALEREYVELKQKQLQIFQGHDQEQPQKSTFFKQNREKAQESEILMMSVSEWVKQQCRKMGIHYNKSEGANFKQICEMLKKKKLQASGNVQK